MVKKLSCVSCGSLKRFPHTFTTGKSYLELVAILYIPKQNLIFLMGFYLLVFPD